jgi:hypothetical protein
MPSDWKNSEEDFQPVSYRLQKMKTKVGQMISSAIGLSGIIWSTQALIEANDSVRETRRSINEAKSVETLTFLGRVFIRLAYAWGHFSMSNQFRPGAKQFWVYFAVPVPLVFLVFVMTFVIQRGA